jgi:biotin-independent malonate decarboxylase gamma subunit
MIQANRLDSERFLRRKSFIELRARERALAPLDHGTFRELLGPFDRLESPWLSEQGVVIHAMAKKAAALVTRRTVEELDELAGKVIPLSDKIEDYAKLGMLHQLIEGVDPESPKPDQIDRVAADLLAAIADARWGPRDLHNRLQSDPARIHRSSTLELRRRLAEQWK